MEAIVTDTIDARAYPLAASKLPMLCEHNVWCQWRAALQHWHRAVGVRVEPELRAAVMNAYLRDPSSFVAGGMPTFNYRIAGISKNVSLWPAARQAINTLDGAVKAMRRSALGRVRAGEVAVIATRPGSIDERWSLIRPDRFSSEAGGGRPEFMIEFGKLVNAGRERFQFRMRDEIGLPMDQAQRVYGEAHMVTEIAALEDWGAPDALGPDRFLGARRQADIDKAVTVPDRYRTLMADLQENLIGRLAAGALVAIDQGMIVPPDVWRDPSKPEHQAIAARVLIRSLLPGDVTEASEQASPDAGCNEGVDGGKKEPAEDKATIDYAAFEEIRRVMTGPPSMDFDRALKVVQHTHHRGKSLATWRKTTRRHAKILKIIQ